MSDNGESRAYSILPANRSALEAGFDLVLAKLIERIAPPFPELMNPAAAPVEFLPYLAADRGVTEWNPSAPADEMRSTVAAAWPTKRQAGTRAALSAAVRGLQFSPEVMAWHEQSPRGAPYSFRVLAWIDRAYDADVDQRLTKRLEEAKSERDTFSLVVGISSTAQIYTAAATFARETVTLYPREL